MKKSYRILLLENIHPVAQEQLQLQGFQVDRRLDSPASEELRGLLRGYDLLGIRSKTEIRAPLLEEARHLLGIGCFCIGTNQVDLTPAKELGIPVFNAPYSNTRSVAELVIAELVALSRQLGDRNLQAHQGGWLKSADGAREVRGKTLGIVGYGHIGTQVSILAEAMGLKVIYFDIVKKLPLGNAAPCAHLQDLLSRSDFVTLHVPETPQTKDMMSEREFRKMKKGSFLLNLSRGTVVVIGDLVRALKEKHLAGCAIDVFPVEPSSNKEKFVSPLQGLPNVILTPHVGGSTEEAQSAIGLEVAESFTRFLKTGSTSASVNFPHVDLPLTPNADRIVNVHRNEPGVLGEINSLVSKNGANILAQQLSTDSKVGYLIMEVERAEAEALSTDIGKLSRSIRTRLISHLDQQSAATWAT
ncbi:MAG: phosphoglycerate dehydrogenase [Bdellovibrio sp.]|nr:MAG: phosphoglycerate dehydrogenase [Bdellovibrio sp.]